LQLAAEFAPLYQPVHRAQKQSQMQSLGYKVERSMLWLLAAVSQEFTRFQLPLSQRCMLSLATTKTRLAHPARTTLPAMASLWAKVQAPWFWRLKNTL
jgi:hypothetical protein